jgi:hypothetical protein
MWHVHRKKFLFNKTNQMHYLFVHKNLDVSGMPETCRVLCANKFEILVHLVGLIENARNV